MSISAVREILRIDPATECLICAATSSKCDICHAQAPAIISCTNRIAREHNMDPTLCLELAKYVRKIRDRSDGPLMQAILNDVSAKIRSSTWGLRLPNWNGRKSSRIQIMVAAGSCHKKLAELCVLGSGHTGASLARSPKEHRELASKIQSPAETDCIFLLIEPLSSDVIEGCISSFDNKRRFIF